MIAKILILSFPLLLLLAAFRDLTSYTIPNWISVALAVAFFVTAPFLGFSFAAVGMHFLVLVVCLLIVMAMFAMGWIGGGDAKLFASIALWMGWPDIVEFALCAALIGGVLTLGLLLARKMWLPGIGPEWTDALMKPGGDVPYGLALAAGALVTFPASSVGAAAFS